MRLILLPFFFLYFVAISAHAARPWDQVPGLRAFIEGKPLALALPSEQGGAQVSVTLNQKPAGPWPFEKFENARWEMARVDFSEESRRHAFRVYSLLGEATPVRVILATGDWVNELPLELGATLGVAAETSYASIIDRYQLRATQYDGLLCLTNQVGERWLMRFVSSQTGPHFSLWTFFDTHLDFALGATPAERSEAFRRNALAELHRFLIPNAKGSIDFAEFEQMIAMGEFIHEADPRAWRKEFAATLHAQLKAISTGWAKHRPQRAAALQKLSARLAPETGDQPPSAAAFKQVWDGSLSLAGAEVRPAPATASATTAASGSAIAPTSPAAAPSSPSAAPASASAATASPSAATASPSAPTATAPAPVADIPTASHPLEKKYWEAFRRAAVPGLSVAQARPFGRALAAGPQTSALLSYLIEAMLAATRPDQSPYFGPEAEARVGKLLTALLALEKQAPTPDEVIAALTAFDEFLQRHTASLNLERAAMELLASPVNAMIAAQYVRAAGRSADFVERWRAPLARQLERHAQAARKQDRHASAAGMFLYAHWIMATPGTPLEPARYTDSSWEGTLTPLQAARRSAAWAAWFCFWPAMDPGAPETRAVIDVINRDPVLARTNFVSVLGFTPGDADTFGAKYRKDADMEKTPFHLVAGNPPAFVRSNAPNAKEPAQWAVVDPPDLVQVRKKMLEARATLKKEIDRYQESRRLWSLDEARARLAEFDGTAPAAGTSPQIGTAQQGLDAARAAYQKDLRDGVYVGRSLDRADTIYTRPLNSMERRSREFELEVMERQLADQQREAQRQQAEINAQAKYRDQLTDDIFQKEKLVDTRGHLAKAAEMKDSVRYWEARYADLLKQGVKRAAESGVTAESIARAQLVRTRLKDGTIAKYQNLAKKAEAAKTVEDEMEMRWFVWLFDFPEVRENVGREVFYGTAEAEEAGKDAEQRGKPLADFAEVLLEPLSSKGVKQASGMTEAFVPRFPPSAAWRKNQIESLLDDAWFRFSHDPYALRGHVFTVVKALRAATATDAATIEGLRPWVRRFRASTPVETQKIVLYWKDEPVMTALLDRAAD